MHEPLRRLIGAAAVMLLGSTLALGQDLLNEAQTTIRKQVDEVNLTFTVTDNKGRFITGLTQDNFAILDDHHPPANVRRFQSLTDLPLRVCVAFDASDSISRVLKYQQEVALAFLKRLLRPGVDQACLIKFTNLPVLLQGFTGDFDALESSVKKVTASGSTSVWDALRFTSETMAGEDRSEPVRRVIVLISDGEDNSSKYTYEQALQSMLRSEIALEAVDTMGNNDAYVTLRRLSTMTGGNIWMGGKPKELAKSLEKIEASLRSQYFVAYQPSGELSRGQFRRIQVKSVGHKGRLAYRTGYFVP